jgi:exonuclease SbcC
MEIRRLKMRGLTRFAELVEVDFAELAGDAELVAIVGGNGEGKTTLVEAMLPGALYRHLPSRPGTLSSWCTARDSLLEVELDHAGDVWRIVHEVDAVGSRGTSANLFRGGEPVTTTGNVRDFDAAIRATFPAESVLLASAFGVQTGAGSFVSLDKAARRDLFVSLLGIDDYQRQAARAAIARGHLDELIYRVDERITPLEDRIARRTSLLREVEVAELTERQAVAHEDVCVADLRLAETRVQQVRAAYERARAELEGARKARTEAAGRVRDIEGRLDVARRQLDDAEGEVERATMLEADEAAERTARATVAALEVEHATAEAEYRAAAAAYRTARDAAEQARTRAVALPVAAVEGPLARLREAPPPAVDEAAEANRKIEVATLQPVADRLASHVRGDATSTAGLDAARAELERLRKVAHLLDEVPCKGEMIDGRDCGSCQLLAQAREAREAIATHEQKIRVGETALGIYARKVQEAQAAVDRLAVLRAEQDADDDRRRKRERWDREVADLDAKLVAARERAELAATAAAAAAAELERGKPIGARRDDVAARLHEARTALEPLAGSGDARQAALRAAAGAPALRARVADLERELATARAALDALPVVNDTAEGAARAALEREEQAAGVTGAREAHERAQAASRRASDALARLRGALDEVGDPAAERAALDVRRATLANRRAGYRLLEQGLGRDGLQALEIDAAGPEVGQIATELLGEVAGGRWSVELRTTRPSADGKRILEVFDLVVYDGDRGGERVFDALSVGEQSVIGEALKLAIAVFNSRRSGTVCRTLWRDEPDAGLSELAAEAYPALLRRAIRLGGFDRAYWITHRRSGWEQADRVIRVEGGRVRLDG